MYIYYIALALNIFIRIENVLETLKILNSNILNIKSAVNKNNSYESSLKITKHSYASP